jgi:predicted O-linked N-acetylglucosamine transferase (SPINDLY family)
MAAIARWPPYSFAARSKKRELNVSGAWNRLDLMDPRTLCNQAAGRHQSGQLEEAARLYLQAIQADPHNFFAHHMLGILRAQQGRQGEALELVAAAIRIDPRSAEALSNYGNLLTTLGRPGEALAAFDRALAIGPAYAETLTNRANILWGMRRMEEALAGYSEALRLKPDLLEALVGRANALHALERPQEALAALDKALALRPDAAPLLRNRGTLFQALKQPDRALADLDRSLALEPRNAEALSNRGIALSHLGRFDEALASYAQALAINPRLVEALSNRGHTLRDTNQPEQALANYEQVLAVDARLPSTLADAANMALILSDWPRVAKYAAEIRARLGARELAMPPLLSLYYDWGPEAHAQCAQAWVNAMPALPVLPSTPSVHDRLRIAYLSSDFRNHPVGATVVELFECHDHTRFEIFAASLGADDGGDVRRRIAAAADHFVDLSAVTDRVAAERLKELEIDILVDLNGHTMGARTQILRQRPAPIQVSYLGFPGTMGADFMDYVIADETVLPFDQQAFYREKIVQLPDTFWVSDTGRAIGVCPSRDVEALPQRGFVFCCFSHNRKITAELFDIWMRLLLAVPDSVLWLKQGHVRAMANLRAAAETRGVSGDRLVFAKGVALDVHLARHALADLFLDTQPYNAHATASDALWAGLPVLTCLGQGFAGRVAASQLRAMGLPELATANLEDYEALALRLARDPVLLSSWRDRLAGNRASRHLFDTDRLRRNLEAAYLEMWRRRGEAPRGFRVGET